MPTEQTLADAMPPPDFPYAWRMSCLVLAAIMVGLLFYLGSLPVAAGLVADHWDKLVHFAFFATLGALLWIAAAGRRPFALIVAVAAIGALDEWHQRSLHGRSADVADFLGDLAGVAFAVLILRRWRR